jgi:hypothetical protein
VDWLLVVVGSQAVLGGVDEPPDSMLQSVEADIYSVQPPEATDLINGGLGDGSQFHAAFGYYAHAWDRRRPRPRAAGRNGWSDARFRRE